MRSNSTIIYDMNENMLNRRNVLKGLAAAAVAGPMLPSVAQAAKKGSPSKQDLAGVKAKIWAAVEAGKLTEEQAKQKWEAYLRDAKRGHDGEDLWAHYRKLGVDEAGIGRIKRALIESGLEGERLEQGLRVVVRVAHGLRKADDPEPIVAKVTEHLAELDYSEEQIERLLAVARRLATVEQLGEGDRAR